ncbi:terpenoid synthase [Daldinia sp. FL1419]|nr:terpenoid synthase [Daldinia sp. FL1419]
MPQDRRGQCSTDTLGARSYVRDLLSSFARNVGYTTAPEMSNKKYWLALYEHAANTAVPHSRGTHSYECLVVGGNYAIACFPGHPLDVQVYIGIYTWLAIRVDDEAGQSPEEFEAFHERFTAGIPQPTILLEGWAQIIRGAFTYWEPIVANFIVCSSLDFHNASVLEARSGFRDLVRTDGGQSFAWYMRSKTGLSDAYAYFTFPKAIYPDISCFLEAVPDLSKYISLANDVLSFYKEDQAGEKDNYIHSRAYYEGKHPQTVLGEVIEEAEKAVWRMRVAIKGREPYEQALNSHVLGYIWFHVISSRYKLSEIGLGETVVNLEVL